MVKKTQKHSRQNKSKTFKRVKCAPKKDKLPFSCYSAKGLHMLKDLWNSRHPDRRITSNDTKQIWEDLKDYMKHCCNNERDWLRHNFVKHDMSPELLNYTFAPDSPNTWKQNPNEWLNSVDIMNVMKQYEHVHKDYEFIGPSPIDYDTHMTFGTCVWEELCNFSLRDTIKRNVKQIGIIFNLDPHYKEGSHWVALFISITKNCICFFDSYGEKPHRQIKKFMNVVESQGKELGLDLHQHWIHRRHQYGDSECGMYCLYFIINMIQNHSVSQFEKKRIPDKKMLELRRKYFN